MSSTTRHGTTITMPKLGESVTEGTLGAWLKQVGEHVDKYEPMVEVVTDKVTAEIPAPISGTIVEIVGQEGDTIPVGGVVCVIAQDGAAPATVTGPVAESPADAAEDRLDAGVNATPTLASTPTSAPTNGSGRSVSTFDERAARESHDEAELLRQRSSPLVRRLAAEHEIALSSIQGTGLGGRVSKADILQVIQKGQQPSVTGPQTAAQPTSAPALSAPPAFAPASTVQGQAAAESAVQLMPGDEVIDASVMRKQIAEHMLRSVQTAPHVTVWMEADMSAIVAARARHKADFVAREGFDLTYLPFVARVVVQALRAFPNINTAWDDGKIIRRKAVNLGVAVALEDGLIVPVIRNADERNVVGLARVVNDLAARARSNKLQPDEIGGGTFTLNNPGTLGSIFSTPIIVQPQAAILSMEAIVKRAVVVNDSIAIRPMMNLSLSLDHRILDGLSGTRFLAAIKQGLETFAADAAIY